MVIHSGCDPREHWWGQRSRDRREKKAVKNRTSLVGTSLPLLIVTGGLIPLFCLEGVPAFPGASQDEAGLTRKFETSHVGGATGRTPPMPRSALEKDPRLRGNHKCLGNHEEADGSFHAARHACAHSPVSFLPALPAMLRQSTGSTSHHLEALCSFRQLLGNNVVLT